MSEFGPKRSQYRGRLAADPSVVGLPAGSWWYRTDLNCWRWFDGTTINYLPLLDETQTSLFYVSTGGGCATGHISTSQISNIIFVVHVDVVKVEPPQCDIYTPIHWAVNVNTIGVTIGAATSTAGTTISVEALFLGYR